MFVADEEFARGRGSGETRACVIGVRRGGAIDQASVGRQLPRPRSRSFPRAALESDSAVAVRSFFARARVKRAHVSRSVAARRWCSPRAIRPARSADRRLRARARRSGPTVARDSLVVALVDRPARRPVLRAAGAPRLAPPPRVAISPRAMVVDAGAGGASLDQMMYDEAYGKALDDGISLLGGGFGSRDNLAALDISLASGGLHAPAPEPARPSASATHELELAHEPARAHPFIHADHHRHVIAPVPALLASAPNRPRRPLGATPALLGAFTRADLDRWSSRELRRRFCDVLDAPPPVERMEDTSWLRARLAPHAVDAALDIDAANGPEGPGSGFANWDGADATATATATRGRRHRRRRRRRRRAVSASASTRVGRVRRRVGGGRARGRADAVAFRRFRGGGRPSDAREFRGRRERPRARRRERGGRRRGVRARAGAERERDAGRAWPSSERGGSSRDGTASHADGD